MYRAHNSPVLHQAVADARAVQVPVGRNANQEENTDWNPAAASSRQLEGIAPFWRALEGAMTSPIQQCLWSESCCATLPLNGKLDFVVVKTGSRTGAIAPLFRAKGPFGRLEHLGVSVLREPTDLVYSDAVALKNLANALVKQGSPLFLDRIPADSPTIAAIQEAYSGRGLVLLRPAHPYPRILLHEGWRQPEGQLNSGRRADLRRAARTAEKIGPLSYQILSPCPSQLAPILEEALEVEAANWKGNEGSAIARDHLRGPFYRHYAAAASAAGILRVCFLRVGGKAVAMQLAIESARGFWLLKIGYREEFARCSPGMLLMAETIRYAASRGLASYEFLGNADNWTRVWTSAEIPTVTIRAYPFRMAGVATLAADTFRAVLRRFRTPVKRKTE
ncbi:MAG TPA: GNAT family N-acetyltransferase [Candidatus Acidoferrum sp.]|nr:GNAT family N-acetyltransferase [Candidatus Acidoferrum sp.]